jgi:tetratricopeptide (TPR) repeat protein
LDLFEEMEERGRLLYNIGIINMALKDDERAISSFTLAIDQDPWFAASFFQRGLIQFSRGKTFEALQDYQICYQVSYKLILEIKKKYPYRLQSTRP